MKDDKIFKGEIVIEPEQGNEKDRKQAKIIARLISKGQPQNVLKNLKKKRKVYAIKVIVKTSSPKFKKYKA